MGNSSHSPNGMVTAGPSANEGKEEHSQPSKVEGPGSIAPSVRDGSEVDQYDVDDVQLGHVPLNSSPGETCDIPACKKSRLLIWHHLHGTSSEAVHRLLCMKYCVLCALRGLLCTCCSVFAGAG